MWLDNYKYCKRGMILAFAKAYAENAAAKGVALEGFVRDVAGATVTSLYSEASAAAGLLGPIVWKGVGTGAGVNGGLSPVFGRGEVQPTAEDYQMSEQISSGLTVAAVDPYFDSNANAIIIPITVTCTLAEGVTINEVGLMKRIYTSQSSASNVLMYREVLAEPLTLAANETGVLTVTVPFN